MGGVLKMLLVLVLLVSASDGSDASRPLKGEAIGRSGAAAGEALMVSAMRAVMVIKAKAGPSGCTYNPNNIGRRCRP
ncbi:hypothetical protein E2562_028216 [Oryza meyeriana var. granulata]|uniref:Uncharacterized protein n=1 Tax=Oryza meyeriana var. granulata TaxID=110450 RepID=A0A6G1DRP1_9ORYZ|nr:hypothetical protein E2562_028216 [Oryza meyeriana var. granulata]